jgi:hypothetical protein
MLSESARQHPLRTAMVALTLIIVLALVVSGLTGGFGGARAVGVGGVGGAHDGPLRPTKTHHVVSTIGGGGAGGGSGAGGVSPAELFDTQKADALTGSKAAQEASARAEGGRPPRSPPSPSSASSLGAAPTPGVSPADLFDRQKAATAESGGGGGGGGEGGGGGGGEDSGSSEEGLETKPSSSSSSSSRTPPPRADEARHRRLAFTRVAGPAWPDFVGTRASHVSSRSCVSIQPFGPTALPHIGPFLSCNLTNVFLETAASNPLFVSLVYVHEVSPSAAGDAAAAAAELAAVQADLARVSPISVHWYRQSWDQLRFTVVGFKAGPAPDDEGGEETGLAAPPSSSSLCECDAPVPAEGDVNVLVSECASANPHCRRGLQVNWPTFLLLREVPRNIGHWTWDNMIPIHSACEDLGLGASRAQLQLLMFDLNLGPGHSHPEWANPLVRGVAYAQYHHPPAFLAPLLARANGQPVRFSHMVAGHTGRSPHEILPTYSIFNADKRVIWKYRTSVVRAMGLDGIDRDYSKGFAGRVRVLIVQKPDKRVITNVDVVRASIEASLRGAGIDAEVAVLDWATLGGFEAEVKRLLDTNVLISMDGTGANNLFFMPPGSVHISLGVRSGVGHANMADFLFTGVDHVRVLYYCCQEPGDLDANTALDVESVSQLSLRAARYVRKGFQVPLPFYLNHAQAGYVCQHLYHKHPHLVATARSQYVEQMSHFCSELRDSPLAQWNKYVTLSGGPDPPDSLYDDVAEAVAKYDALHAEWGLD